MGAARIELSSHPRGEIKFRDALPLLPFLMVHKASGVESVGMMVPTKSGERVYLIIRDGALPAWDGVTWLDESYYFVRYLTEAESFTISGGKP